MAKIKVANVPGVSKLTPGQLNYLAAAAEELGIPIDWLATVISFETAGTFSPKIRNAAGSGAFGLIQFMPSTAQNLLKTSTKESAVLLGTSMSFEEQLQRMVIPYLKSYKGKFNSLSDVYLAIFYPAAMNKTDDWVVGKPGSAVYRQNQGFDKTGKGYITRKDITAKINQILNNAIGMATLEVGGHTGGWGVGWTLFLSAIATAVTYGCWVDIQSQNSRILAGKRRADAYVRKQLPAIRAKTESISDSVQRKLGITPTARVTAARITAKG